MSARLPCPHCQKLVADAGALYQHVKAKHGRGAAKVFRQPRESEDQSIASDLVDALQSGERPAHLVDMFPEEFAHG